MDNSTQTLYSKEKPHTQHFGAHSGSRAGISDYNDGGRTSHYGGNEDSYTSDENQEEENDFDGKIAYGNDLETDDEEDYGKYHSGL